MGRWVGFILVIIHRITPILSFVLIAVAAIVAAAVIRRLQRSLASIVSMIG